MRSRALDLCTPPLVEKFRDQEIQAKPPGSFTRHVIFCHNRAALGVAHHQSFSVPEGRTDEMGQALTTPVPDSKLIDINLSKQALESLWTSYNLISEGWVRNAYSALLLRSVLHRCALLALPALLCSLICSDLLCSARSGSVALLCPALICSALI